MFHKIIKVITKCHSVLTATVIENEPQIVVTDNSDFPEIKNRLITFKLNEDVQVEDIVITTFDTKTIENKKYVNSKKSYSSFSVQNLSKSEYMKQVELKMGYLGNFDEKFLKSKVLKKLNEDLRKVHNDSPRALIRYKFEQIFKDLRNQNLWDSFFDEDFYDSLLQIKETDENAIKNEVDSIMWNKFTEWLKQSVINELETYYNEEILYLTEDYEDINHNFELSDYKYQFPMKTGFWPHVKKALEEQYGEDKLQFWENNETGEDFVGLIAYHVFKSIADIRYGHPGDTYIKGLLSKEKRLTNLNTNNIRHFNLFDEIERILNSINLSTFVDKLRKNHTAFVKYVISVLKSFPSYLATDNLKDFQRVIEKYISKFESKENIYIALKKIEKCLKDYQMTKRSFVEETQIFNLLQNESVAFNFKITFKGADDKIQSIFSKYYTVKEEALHAIEEIPLSPTSNLSSFPEKLGEYTGALNSKWFYISIFGISVVSIVITIYLLKRDKY